MIQKEKSLSVKNNLVNWDNIKRRIKYDGKLLSPTEELELEIAKEKQRLLEKEERRNKWAILKSQKLKLEREKEERLKQDTIELVKKQEQLEKLELDLEEKLVDNELDYMNKMYIPCPSCGEDIMDADSKCRANQCINNPTWVIPRSQMLE